MDISDPWKDFTQSLHSFFAKGDFNRSKSFVSPRRADGSRPLFGARGIKRRDGREFDFVDKKRDGREDNDTRDRHALICNKDRSYMRTCREEMPLFGPRGDAVREADGREARHEQRRKHKDYDARDRLGSPEGPEYGGIEEEERDEVPPMAYSYRPNQESRNVSINVEDRRDRRRVGEPLASADMGPP